MNLTPGMLVTNDGWWYVVVNVNLIDEQIFFECICDNANNTYVYKLEEITHMMTLEEIKNVGWNGYPERIPIELRNRGIPTEEILETLLGKHKERFP